MEIRELLQVSKVDKKERNQMRRVKDNYRKLIKTLLQEIDDDTNE